MSERGSSDDKAGADMTQDRLRLATGFAASERPGIVDQFGALDARLRSFDSDSVDMELSVKERDGADQHVTLEIWIAGRERLVSTSSRADMRAALQEVRDDAIRQIGDDADRQVSGRHRVRR